MTMQFRGHPLDEAVPDERVGCGAVMPIRLSGTQANHSDSACPLRMRLGFHSGSSRLRLTAVAAETTQRHAISNRSSSPPFVGEWSIMYRNSVSSSVRVSLVRGPIDSIRNRRATQPPMAAYSTAA